MNPPEKILEKLRQRGMKVTAQRAAICRHLVDNHGHPTAERIFSALRPSFPGLSLSTVYKTLEALGELGEVRAVRLGGGGVHFDPHVEPHHHAVCRACGSIQDVENEDVRPSAPPALRPSRRRGFTVEGRHIVFSGLCASCAPGPGSRSRFSRTKTQTRRQKR